MKILALSASDMEHASSVVTGLSSLEIEKLSTREGPFPGTPHHRLTMAQHHLDLVKNHDLSDVKAIYLDTFGDYGLDAVRSYSGLPVIGAGESSLVVARALAPRFLIVTVWPESMRFIYTERLQSTRTGDACAGVIHVKRQEQSPSAILKETRAPQGQLKSEVLIAARKAIRDMDVDAIVLGCTCMAGMHQDISQALPVPVICPSRTGLGFALGAAVCGWRQSDRLTPRK